MVSEHHICKIGLRILRQQLETLSLQGWFGIFTWSSCLLFCSPSIIRRVFIGNQFLSGAGGNLYIYIYISKLDNDQATLLETDLLKAPENRIFLHRKGKEKVSLGHLKITPETNSSPLKTLKIERIVSKPSTSWWFQPTWNILVKMGIFPQV